MTEKTKKCMICGKPSDQSICEPCKANIQGESLDKKMKVERKVPVSQVPPKKERGSED